MTMAEATGELIARRQFAPLYIWLDIAFLLFLMGLLLWKRRYTTVLVGLAAGVLYFAVDFGIFHLALHSRTISPNASLFWVLLWMSMSYGFTNFVWIWLWLRRDPDLVGGRRSSSAGGSARRSSPKRSRNAGCRGRWSIPSPSSAPRARTMGGWRSSCSWATRAW